MTVFSVEPPLLLGNTELVLLLRRLPPFLVGDAKWPVAEEMFVILLLIIIPLLLLLLMAL